MPIATINTWLQAIAALFVRNWLTMLGGICATIGSLLIIAFFAHEWLTGEVSAFLALFGFLLLPAIFVLGLLLIPLGAWRDRRRRRKAREAGLPEPAPYPVFDLNNPITRRAVALVAFLTIVNIFIISTVTFRGVHYSESAEFCGTMCHDIMEPQYAAFLESPHSRVDCTKCHTRPGAIGFVEQKIAGMREVYAKLTDTYPQPLPVPVEHLPETAETCEQCHNPLENRGDVLRVTRKFRGDEANTPITSVLVMHLGGGGNPGIHGWHNDPDVVTEYYAHDDAREDIAYVRVTGGDGEITEYMVDDEDFDPEDISPDELRRMDCTDCHNRTGHPFAMPDQGLDRKMAAGLVSPEIPYIKARGVEVLEAAVEADDGPAYIANELRAYYQNEHPGVYAEQEEALERAIAEIQDVYQKNVFPYMNVTWETYPDHIGHTRYEGCYRCHNTQLRTENNQPIGQNCLSCHQVVAWDQHEPDILQVLGL